MTWHTMDGIGESLSSARCSQAKMSYVVSGPYEAIFSWSST